MTQNEMPADTLAAQRASKQILIVDDNPTNLLLLQKILAKAGYQSDIAVNGLDALKMASDKDYHLILLDVMMPVMNGLETARLLREHEHSRQHRPLIVAVTAAEPEECQRLINHDHIDDFIRKGNHYVHFSERIIKLLEN